MAALEGADGFKPTAGNSRHGEELKWQVAGYEEAKAQLVMFYVDAELQRLNVQAAVLQTARMVYSKALNELLGANQTH